MWPVRNSASGKRVEWRGIQSARPFHKQDKINSSHKMTSYLFYLRIGEGGGFEAREAACYSMLSARGRPRKPQEPARSEVSVKRISSRGIQSAQPTIITVLPQGLVSLLRLGMAHKGIMRMTMALTRLQRISKRCAHRGA